MNTINDLIKQSYVTIRTPSGEESTYFSQEKFAELIIRECAESLWTEECYNSDLALEEFEKNSKKIREHFGVEE